MTETEFEKPAESHVFEADVTRLLHMMVHSVYSDRNVFLRELISNAADACEKLRYEAITDPNLSGSDTPARITLMLDAEANRLAIEDNGIGMSRVEMIEALGTIARSGTRAFMERIEAGRPKSDGEEAKTDNDTQLIGQFGVGFYSCFMVADRVEVVSRRAGSDEAWRWSSDGKGSYSVDAVELSDAPARGTRITLFLLDDAKTFTQRSTVERVVKEQSGHVPVPIVLLEENDAEPVTLTDGSALWKRPRTSISTEEYADFYRGLSGQHDEPALTVHFRAEGRHEFSALAFVPGAQPFDMFDPDRKGRVKLYVKRIFITDEADLLPRYLRFVRGLVDTDDLPLNMSREMIQESPILSTIRKGVTNRILTSMEKLAENDRAAFTKLWDNFGAVIKEGLYEDFERQKQILGLARFRTTESGEEYRSLSEYIADAKEGQDAIYYIAGGNLTQLRNSPQLEGFRARGIEVLLLTDQIDSFWVMNARDFEGKAFHSISQGAADLSKFARTEAEGSAPEANDNGGIDDLVAFAKLRLADAVSDVRVSDRLTESAVCLVAAEGAYDKQLEKILQGAGRIDNASRPVLELNASHGLVKAIAAQTDDALFREDAVLLLLDQARILDGERPEEPRAFAERLQRVFERALKPV